ncbi:hypothetical protein B0H13DRAFT_2319634 [Mycena leptocephala]|nr:hypothetical protein B0H13DRAFT_2319634 [Mycena leptocephala]
MAVTIRVVRFVVMTTVILLALVALGVAVALILTGSIFFIPFFSYAGLAIASAALTLLTLPAMIFFEIIKPNRPMARTIVEIVWLGKSQLPALTPLDFVDRDRRGGANLISNPVTCQENSVVEAFAFLNGLILILYVITLIVVSLLASRRKHLGMASSIGSASSSGLVFKDPMHSSYPSHSAVNIAGGVV